MDYNNPNPEFWLKEVNIKLNVLTLMAVHGNLLLALRHPQNVGLSRDMVLKFVIQIGNKLVALGAITDEKLKHAYEEEAMQGSMGFMLFDKEVGTTKTSVSNTDLDVIYKNGKCCACGDPMDLSLGLNFLMLDKKAKWKHPVWDNMLIKPGIERIPRAMAVVCNDCMDDGTKPVEVIEVDGNEIRYHKIEELENAFQITEDMVAQNVKVEEKSD